MRRKDDTPDNIELSKMPPRQRDGHKGTFGRVLVIGGSVGMIGAPVFAGTAALRMGSGLVQIAVPASIMNAALTVTPELIAVAIENQTEVLRAARLADAIVIGPGLGPSEKNIMLAKRILALAKPVVIDAGGLTIFSDIEKWPSKFKARVVLTPHPAEMARLLNEEQISADRASRKKIAMSFAKKFGQTVVLKGAETIVTDGFRTYVNQTGDSSLAKAGTGDVLSGMIASLLARDMPLPEAASLAVNLHGVAGELAGKKMGTQSVLARDVLNEIHNAIDVHTRDKRS